MSTLLLYGKHWISAMKIYRVEVAPSAIVDVNELANFLFENMSREAAYRYLDMIGQEMESLSIFANCVNESQLLAIKEIHPHARRMISHNHKWNYVFHTEKDTVVIDRLLKSKLLTQ